jgi:erythromycin esterase-like protein
MKISFLQGKTGRMVELNEMISHHSVGLDDPDDLDPLLEQIGDARFVLLGEASHGTHEYYTWRTQISKRLIEEKGFSFIAVEGDWPDCYRLNRYVKNYPDAGKSAYEVLHAFNRWPTWMWANWEIVALAEWLKQFNVGHPRQNKVGFYGLDVYSLWESLAAIIAYLDKKDPGTKHTAMEALACFEPYSDDEGRAYARANRMVPAICEDEVVDLLYQIRKNMRSYNTDREAVMSAEQNAHVIVNAERYYRAMISAGSESWNIRDHHMADTLYRLMDFYGPEAKGIVWEHNTHIGDARATDMARQGLVNVGQLVREDRSADGVYTVGFGSFKGTVVAGQEWGDVMRVMHVPEAMPDSWEHILHQLGGRDRIVFMNGAMGRELEGATFPHRAIGVVYHPRYEKPGNYVRSRITERYDAFIYLDRTTALHPLHIVPDGYQMPETFPFGI